MRVSFLGAKHLLPSSLQKKMMEVEAATKNNTSFKLNLLVAYGGREEILSAVKKLLKEKDLKPEELTEESFKKYLYLESEPDLIIRTGHACLSGLLPWQSIYSEIIFLEDKYWPEFSKQDFEHCLSEFSKRRRSFGK
jgi:tritrans,polycis-undecaprenyl-diphosphate synthase [geranylgeranyl-diphosphate specific]